MISYQFNQTPNYDQAQADGSSSGVYDAAPGRPPAPSPITLAKAARIMVEIGCHNTRQNAPGLAFVAAMLDAEHDAKTLAQALTRALATEADAGTNQDQDPAQPPARYRDPFANGSAAFTGALMEALRPGQRERQKQQKAINLMQHDGIRPQTRNPLVDDIRLKRDVHNAVHAAREAAREERQTTPYPE